MRSARERPHAREAFGREGPHAGEAFAGERRSLRRSGGSRERLAVVVLSLGIAVVAQVIGREIVTWRRSQLASQAGRASVVLPSWCVSERTPALARVDARERSALRAIVEAAVRSTGGEVYAAGSVPPSDVWSDDAPEAGSPASSASARWPGGFEIREWAPDPQWGASYRDDIAGDAFLFATAGQARSFFAAASDPACHRLGSAGRAARPAQARTLVWLNPDGEAEEDLFLLRGRLVYRVVDVRPQDRRPPPSRAETDEGVATVEAYACDIPAAVCARSSADGVHA